MKVHGHVSEFTSVCSVCLTLKKKSSEIKNANVISCLKGLLLEIHCDVESARPDLHVFYSDGKSEKTWTLSVQRVQVL